MWLCNSPIGRKVVMSVTGVALILFLTFHMSMNLVALFSGEAYNAVCEFLGANWYALIATLALAALAVADAYGVPLADAAEKLLEFGGFKNRQQIYHKNGYTIVDDTYNASPDSMKAAIGVLSSLPAGRRIAVLADMKELGENTIQFHREVGAFLAEKPVDILVVYGELAQAIAEGAKKVKPDLHVVSFEEDEKEDMLDWLDAQIGEGDAVLFKGSNSMKLGETAARFISVEKTSTSSGGE